MRTIRQQYWRYSLFVLILGLGITVFVELLPFLGGLLGAATLYILLRRQMWHLTERRKWRRSAAASLLLGEAILCFLMPMGLIIWMFMVKVKDLSLDPQAIVGPVKHWVTLVGNLIGYNLWREDNLTSLVSYLPQVGKWIITSVMRFAANIVVVIFVLYFMLLGGSRMEAYCREILPFNHTLARRVMHEINKIVHSNAIGIPLLAAVQGVVAYIGYLAFGVPSPLFWGVITLFATVIPLVGTALVWLPIAIYMTYNGNWGAAVGLVLYGSLVVTHVDNVGRFVMQRKMADIHPLVTIFGVIIGLSLFGFMGVIFGPLLLDMLIFCVNVFKRKYLDRATDEELFEPRNLK